MQSVPLALHQIPQLLSIAEEEQRMLKVKESRIAIGGELEPQLVRDVSQLLSAPSFCPTLTKIDE
jgi:hypothetical protein